MTSLTNDDTLNKILLPDEESMHFIPGEEAAFCAEKDLLLELNNQFDTHQSHDDEAPAQIAIQMEHNSKKYIAA